MNEIGARLGVQVEYRNFAFDGLGNALLLDQIDLAIAAISVTADRAAVIDFSNIYYVTEDAILAPEGGQIVIGGAEDLANLRVGVQNASVHQEWAQTNLVDGGLLPSSDLYGYQQIDQAVADLRAGRLDRVILDLPVAQRAVQAGGVAIAGQGLNQQRLAIALKKGTTSLKTEIDGILADLQSEGVVARLAEQYLDIDPDDLLPTPTPTAIPAPNATPTPTPPPAPCIDSLALVEHLTLNDRNMTAPPELQPGQSFTKGWRVRNVGTCTWDTNYRLIYIHGSHPAARMGGQPLPVSRPVAPNETYDIQLNLVAPLRPGTYQGFWQMTNSFNIGFGERLPVGIRVPAPPTPTPAPTQTPAPGISFTVDRTNIKQGECVTFSWNVQNVREVYFYAQGQRWQDHGVPGQSQRTECPGVTTTYNLRVVKTNGSVEIRQLTIYVEPVVDAPTIARFTVDPAPRIVVGQCVDIRWEVRGEVDRVTITANNVSLWDGAPTAGSLDNCPPGTGTVEYALEAAGPGGSSRKVRTITVVQPTPTSIPPTATAIPPTATEVPPTDTPIPPTGTPVPPTDTPVPPTDTPVPPTNTPVPPTPTPEPEAPVIRAFEASPSQIEVGTCVNISWRAGGGTSRVQIKRDGSVVLDNAPVEGSEQDCSLTEPGTVVYSIEASNSVGQTVSREQTVTVNEAIPENPLAGTDWLLQNVLTGTNLTASFGPDGSLNGSAGCNSFGGTYSVNGQSLSIGALGASQQLCGEPEGIMEQEAAYLTALSSAASFEIDGDVLTIQDGGGDTVLTFGQLVATPL